MEESRITITLYKLEREALAKLARIERRDTRGQAAILIRRELKKIGLLSSTDFPDDNASIQLQQKQNNE